VQATTTASAPATTAHGHRHLGLALALISTVQLMVVLDATIVNIALPSMQRDLHFSATGLEWVVNGYALAFGGLLLLGGRTGDLYGKRRMFMAGVALFTAASLTGGFATTQVWLIAARMVQGVGGAIASPTALSLVTSTFPEGRSRDRAMGVYAAMSSAGASIGLLLGGILTDLASWRWVLFVNVPIGALVVIAAPLVLGETEGRQGRLDLPGAVSVTAGMSFLVYGLSHAASASWSTPLTVGSLAGAAVLLAAFLAIEARSTHALMPLRVFANRNRSGAYGMMLIIGAGLFAMFFYLTLFVQDILGFSPLKAGLVSLPISLTIAACAGLSSRVVGRIGARPLLAAGPLVSAAGLAWISRVTPASTFTGDVLGPELLIAIGMGLTFVPLTLTAVAGARPGETGLVSALLNTGQQLGGSLGLAVLVTIATAVTRPRLLAARSRAATAAALTAGYSRAFLVAGAFLLAGSVIALVVVRAGRPPAPATLGRAQRELGLERGGSRPEVATDP